VRTSSALKRDRPRSRSALYNAARFAIASTDPAAEPSRTHRRQLWTGMISENVGLAHASPADANAIRPPPHCLSYWNCNDITQQSRRTAEA
jgi:hypothetical protein